MTAFCLVFFFGVVVEKLGSIEARSMHEGALAMRYDDEEDPKAPRPASTLHKGDNPLEAQEYAPRKVGPRGGKDDRRDHHRHVHRC